MQRFAIVGNHASEAFRYHLKSYMDTSGIDGEIFVGPYDDSMALENSEQFDVAVFWLDLDRIKNTANAEASLLGSFTASNAPLNFLFTVGTDGLRLASFNRVAMDTLRGRFIVLSVVEDIFPWTSGTLNSIQRRAFEGTLVPSSASRQLASLTISLSEVLLKGSAPKALILDLDDTLYSGSVIDDGPSELGFDESHESLIATIELLASRGLLIVVATRNEPSDAYLALELPQLKVIAERVVHLEASFKPKVELVGNCLSFLGFGADSCIFLDDSASNVLEARSAFPGLHAILAGQDCSHLLFFLGLSQIMSGDNQEEAMRRVGAYKVKSRIEKLAERDPVATNLQLGVSISAESRSGVSSRALELFNRTNQFNATLRRTSPEGLDVNIELYQSIEMSYTDDLVDSGVIAVVLLQPEHSTSAVEILELVISCRVLGRGNERAILAGMVASVFAAQPDLDLVQVSLQKGPKNDLVFETFNELEPIAEKQGTQSYVFRRSGLVGLLKIMQESGIKWNL